METYTIVIAVVSAVIGFAVSLVPKRPSSVQRN